MSRLGFVGTGHIAEPMVRFLARKGHQITVSERSTEVSARLSRGLGVGVAGTQEVLEQSDILFLCLRPQQAATVLEDLGFRADHQVVSVMAGISTQELATLCAPAADFVQTIPLGYLEQGGCPLPGLGNHALLRTLFEPENPVIPVSSETTLNKHFAICAMVPGILDLMATGAGWLGAQSGDDAAAEAYTTQLLAGYLAALPKGANQLAAARDSLATEGTLSLQMTSALRAGGVHAVLTETLTAIGKRLEQADG